MFEAPSAERQFADPNVMEGNTVEGSFRHFTANMGQGKASRGRQRQHLICLTINFDDMHRIFDIFSKKAVCQTISATPSLTQ
jgi:hypothetical protein